MKIATLEDLGILEILMPTYVFVQTKMTLLSFETLGNVYESFKSCISIGHFYQPHPVSMLCTFVYMCMLELRTLTFHLGFAMGLKPM